MSLEGGHVLVTQNGVNGNHTDYIVTDEDGQEHEEKKDNFNRKIFIGNIGYRTSWKTLHDFFSKFGKVVWAHIVKDHLKKLPRGIAFVTFATQEEAERVLQAANDELVLEGRTLRVHWAEESKRVSLKKYAEVPELTGPQPEKDINSVLQQNDVAMVMGKHEDVGRQMSDLNDDLLLLIFSFLSIRERTRLERVCHRWQNLSLKTWKSLKSLHFRNMFKRFGGLTDKLLNSMLQRCGTTVTSLDLSASPRLLTDYSLDIIAHFCPDLTFLDLSGVAVTNKSLRNLATACKKLKNVKLQKCFHVGEKGLWWVLHHCKELESFDIDNNSKITGKCFHMAGPHIRLLGLNSCSALSEAGIGKIAELCPLVEELHIQSCISLTHQAIEIIGTSFTNMKILEASGGFPETNLESWCSLGHAANLVELDLSQNHSVGDRALIAIATGCKQLRNLDISGCHHHVTSVGVQMLSQLPVLDKLAISYIHTIGDESIELLAVNGKLRKFTARACGSLTDNGLKTLADHCCGLINVDLSGNLQVTNVTLSAFVSSAQEFSRRLMLHLGGTSVVPENVTLPSCVEVNLMDLSMYHLRPDRELLIPAAQEDEDEEEDEFPEAHEARREFVGAGQEVGLCPWEEGDDDGQYDDLVDDFLDGDDPLAEEMWDLG